ncbi:GIY-YIG nuclease family protein [Mycoplasmopsis mucosicanis]|uniref:GIY-YIG nuclease family protein n=1 Tax=Mycoplasmopsis mucosicanis TaxID=458208 RepID=A0A507SIS2_9BACT|nr:GIY-YIG nuclease family protein [Mycoplasmopsis mucosicanis]TQC51620.1 GIY-YIG nuclease family protein [Mycoplasmopsis mucosicanis]
MSKPKNYNYFLMDGEPTGRIKCTMSNWTGIALKIPINLLKNCKDRKETNHNGIYFLFNTDEQKVYIGQAAGRKNEDGLYRRVTEHQYENTKVFNEIVMITAIGNYLGATELNYLENKFTTLAKEADRYELINKNEPPQGNVTEEKVAELEEFIEYSKNIVGVLGYKIFIPLVSFNKTNDQNQTTTNQIEEPLILYCSRKKKGANVIAQGQCVQTNEGYVLLRGSIIEPNFATYVPPRLIALHEELIKKKEIDENCVLQKDLVFSSPSTLSSFVLGSSSNGWDDLKTKDGIKLKDLK